MIPYGHQSVDDDDIAAVTKVLKSDWLTQGPAVEEFEAALAKVTQARFAVAFANGTAALHAAAAAAGLGSGDFVTTSPLTFVASANCARFVGARVEFVDIDPETLNVDVCRVPRCDGLIAVHYAGLPVDLSRLRRRPRVVIEDAAHALGGVTADGPVGNCSYADMCTFSFHPVKTVTTGEGGAVTTNSPELSDRLRRFRNHGIVHRPDRGSWYYEVTGPGFNYRLTDFQAALGSSQLRKLEAFVSRRNALADRYRVALAPLPVGLPPAAPSGWRHAYHLFVVRIDNRDRVLRDLAASGIGTQVHYVPVYRHPLYADTGGSPRDFPRTEEAFARILSLPLFPALSEEQQDLVVTALEAAL